jgi:hypothetical protein
MAIVLLCQRHVSVVNGLAYGDETAESVFATVEEPLSISSFVLAPRVQDIRQKSIRDPARNL